MKLGEKVVGKVRKSWKLEVDVGLIKTHYMHV